MTTNLTTLRDLIAQHQDDRAAHLDAIARLVEASVRWPERGRITGAALLADLRDSGIAQTERGGHPKNLTMLGITARAKGGGYELLQSWLLLSRLELARGEAA